MELEVGFTSVDVCCARFTQGKNDKAKDVRRVVNCNVNWSQSVTELARTLTPVFDMVVRRYAPPSQVEKKIAV